jgi:ferritin-like metal-binding protein YciE
MSSSALLCPADATNRATGHLPMAPSAPGSGTARAANAFLSRNPEAAPMSAKSLKDVYSDELKDLWSANDQMAKVVKVMAGEATDKDLKSMLKKSVDGIKKHAETIEELLEDADEDAEKEHCKGMEGLVKEATKHITKEAPKSSGLLDIVIIAQYQRMSHYGLAGFGTAAAYAKALGLSKHVAKLEKITATIHESDEYASTLAEHAESAATSEKDAKTDEDEE